MGHQSPPCYQRRPSVQRVRPCGAAARRRRQPRGPDSSRSGNHYPEEGEEGQRTARRRCRRSAARRRCRRRDDRKHCGRNAARSGVVRSRSPTHYGQEAEDGPRRQGEKVKGQKEKTRLPQSHQDPSSRQPASRNEEAIAFGLRPQAQSSPFRRPARRRSACGKAAPSATGIPKGGSRAILRKPTRAAQPRRGRRFLSPTRVARQTKARSSSLRKPTTAQARNGKRHARRATLLEPTAQVASSCSQSRRAPQSLLPFSRGPQPLLGRILSATGASKRWIPKAAMIGKCAGSWKCSTCSSGGTSLNRFRELAARVGQEARPNRADEVRARRHSGQKPSRTHARTCHYANSRGSPACTQT